ncbi:MAG: SurA N-terminal domain-containing protein [Thermodesulfovibrionales bacterium]
MTVATVCALLRRENMAKRAIRVLAAVLCVCTSSVASGATIDRVIAVVNKEPVTLSDYKKFVSRMGVPPEDAVVDEKVVRMMIEEKIILFDAAKKGFTATDQEVEASLKSFQQQNGLSPQEFEKRLSEEKLSLAEYKNLLRENIMALKNVDREVNSKIFVADSEVDAYYEQNRKLFSKTPERLLVKAIFMKISETPSLTEITNLKIRSLKISAEIKKGESFEKMVSLYADEVFRLRDGVLGEFDRGTLIPALEEKIAGMKEGEVSEPVWTKEGVYILKLARRTPETYLPLADVRQQVRQSLYDRKRDEKYTEWIKELWKQSSVTINLQ